MEQLTAAPAETAVLDDLKAKLNDLSLPTVDLAQALADYLEISKNTHRQLAEKLGTPSKRSYYSELIALLKIPASELEKIQGQVLSRSTVQELLSGYAKSPVDQRRPSLDQDVDHVDQGLDHVDQGVDQIDQAVDQEINPLDQVKSPKQGDLGGFPLIRDSINALVPMVFFWVREPKLGQIVERWLTFVQDTGWMSMTFHAIYFSLSVCGLWFVSHNVHLRFPLWFAPRAAVSSGAAVPVAATAVPMLQLTGQRLISGNRMELRWTPGPAGTQYQVYWNSADGETIEHVGGTVKTPGAIVEIAYADFHRGGFLTVEAIAPDNTTSASSARIPYEPIPLNRYDLTRPLPLEGTTVPKTATMAKSPLPPLSKGEAVLNTPPLEKGRLGGILPPPTEVHVDVKTPDLIRISWRAVGKDVRYNIYSSTSRDLLQLRKENETPVKSNQVEWTPETGQERYWIVITTLDAENHESTYSEAVEVVRHPEKSGPGTADAAAGVIRRVLPW